MPIAIVGHGPHCHAKGPLIDQHAVVRLKNPTWETRADHGKRCDYMCASTETMLGMLDYPKTPKEYWAQPKRGSYSKETEKRFLERTKAPLRIPLELFIEWNHRYLDAGMTHTNFSLGSAAILFALALTDEREIFLAGFDNLLDPSLMDYRKIDRGKWRSDHDWKTEHDMLRELERHFNAQIKGL